MANKNFQNYAIAGNNVALTYDNVNDTVTFDVNVDKNDVGLGNVDNTSDIDKPISTLVQNALNLKQDAITLTTTGSSGASTFAANVLNIPTYTLSGLGGQPLATNLTSISALTFVSTSFVKMTAAGTFALDTNTYLTAESDTLASVTGRGNTTTNAITVGGLTANQSVTASGAIARGVYMNQTLVASANGDVLTALEINPTFTNGAFTGVANNWINLIGNAAINGTNQIYIRRNNADVLFASSAETVVKSVSTGSPLRFAIGATKVGEFSLTTGNLILQNGGTFTDAGFRLDVVGADSRFNGIRAGLGAGQVATNTVFGFAGLNANSTGMRNTAIGYQALTLSTGNNNTAVGSGTLSVNTTGSSNVGVGVGALVTNTTGLDNTACGTAALNQNITGDNNTAFGRNALLSNQTGIQITAIGRSALQNNTASNNTAVGYQAALANTTGTGITAIGYQALKDSTGANNTAIGFQSLSAHTTGTNNTALGHLTVSGNFSGCLILGKDATATANNQFVVGSSTVNAGSITAASSPTINEYWTVIINGVSKKIALIA